MLMAVRQIGQLDPAAVRVSAHNWHRNAHVHRRLVPVLPVEQDDKLHQLHVLHLTELSCNALIVCIGLLGLWR